MTASDIHLFFHTFSSLAASITSITYVIRWKNGKSTLGIACFLIFGYLAWAHGNAFLNNFDRATYGAIYIRPVLHLGYLPVAIHFAIDWMRNIINLISMAIEMGEVSIKLNPLEKIALIIYLKLNKKDLGIELE